MIIIGLTGGMASGKSTVSAYLKQNNIPVIDCDEESRHVLDKGTNGYNRAVEEFSDQILLKDGTIDRKKLASIVFADKSLLQKLNSIIHPEVIARTHELLAEYNAKGFGVAVIDAPLLIEAGMHTLCDELWVVYTSPEVQIQRAMARDGATLEQVQERIKNQSSMEEKKKLADRLISNDGTIQELYAAIDKILKETVKENSNG